MAKFVLLLATALSFLSCVEDEGPKTFVFINRTDTNLYIADMRCEYPDTSLNGSFVKSLLKYPESYCVEANTVRNGLSSRNSGSYKEYYEQYGCDTVMFYIFDEQVLKNSSSEQIVKEYLVLQRYDLSYKDLKNLKFKLQYPPSSDMRGMAMYPPYEIAVSAE